MTQVRRGDRSPLVVALKHRLAELGALVDPDLSVGRDLFDEAVERAVRAFQQERGLTADGIVGPETERALDEAGWQLGDRVLHLVPDALLAGDDVFVLQRRLLDLGFKTGRVDGRYGPNTERAVRDFQRNTGLPADGSCGPATLKSLERLAPLVRGGSPNALRAEERLRREGPQLTGKVVVVDAAASRVEDPALRELADLVATDLARRVESRLATTGVRALLTTVQADSPLDEPGRAEVANRLGAHLVISLQVGCSDNPAVGGVSTYYYGIASHGVRSSVGERFAGLVQRELVARSSLVDLRSHPRSWDLLRRTTMPAVRVEVGHVTHPPDKQRLADPEFRDTVAEAVVVAVQRLYLTPDDDPETGVLRLDEIKAGLRARTAGSGA